MCMCVTESVTECVCVCCHSVSKPLILPLISQRWDGFPVSALLSSNAQWMILDQRFLLLLPQNTMQRGQLQLTSFSSVLSINFYEDADVKCSVKWFRALQEKPMWMLPQITLTSYLQCCDLWLGDELVRCLPLGTKDDTVTITRRIYQKNNTSCDSLSLYKPLTSSCFKSDDIYFNTSTVGAQINLVFFTFYYYK